MATAALSLSAAAADFTGSFGKDLNGNGKISVVDNADGKTVKVKTYSPLFGISPSTKHLAHRTGACDQFDMLIDF